MRRSTTGMLATSALLGVALLAPTPALAVDGEFAAEANGSQLFVDAVNFGALTAEPPVGSVAQIGVAPTQGQVDTAGLGDGDAESRGFGQNLDLSLLDQQVPLDLSTAEQTAPQDNDEPTVSTLADLSQAAPLLAGAVSQSTAFARDPEAVECPDQDGRAVVSEGTSTTTDLGVLEIEEGTSLVSVQDPGDGTLTSSSGTYVGSDGQVIAESSAQTAAANVADELVVEVVNPTLTATASGTSGGASVEYTGEVRVNGEKIAGAQENELSLEALRDVLLPLDEEALNSLLGPIDENVVNPLLEPLSEALPLLDGEALTGETLVGLIDDGAIQLQELAFLSPTVLVTAGQLENVTESPDGTRASGEVKTVRIELNVVSTLTETEVPILTVHLMPMSVSAQAPAGGVDCGDVAEDDRPIAVRKDASSRTVQPGQSFDYQITVENRGSCTMQDITVTDTVSLGGSPFTGSLTAPDADSVSEGVVTFTPDELEPGEIATFTITVQVPEGASGTFVDEVTATGVCNEREVTDSDVFSGPNITSDVSADGCDVSTSTKQATHREVRPGQQYAYILRVANTGGADCGETTVTDTLPANVEFLSCSPSCTDSDRSVTFVLDELPAGASQVLTITVTAPDDSNATIDDNTALIDPASDVGDPVSISSPSPDIVDAPVFTEPDLGAFMPDDGDLAGGEAPTEQLPRTGGGAAMLALGALAAAGALRRRS